MKPYKRPNQLLTSFISIALVLAMISTAQACDSAHPASVAATTPQAHDSTQSTLARSGARTSSSKSSVLARPSLTVTGNRQTRRSNETGATTKAVQKKQSPKGTNAANGTNVVQATTLKTITVTAKRRAEPLMNTPSSIAVMTSDRMRALNVQQLSDIGRYFANVQVSSSAVVIRGVGNGSHKVGFKNRVGVYVDGVYVGQSPALDQLMLGISQVNVLRGPQGTLFGKNTEAGAINIITQRPSHHFEGAINLRIGNYNLRESRVHLTGPIAQGIYGGMYLGSTFRNGFQQDITNGDSLWGQNRRAFRGQLEVDRFTNWKLYATADYMRADEFQEAGRAVSNALGTAPVSPKLGFFQVSSDHTPRAPKELWGGMFEADYSLPNEATLKSISSYRDTRYSESFDIDYSPLQLANAGYQYRYKQFTEELQLLSPKSDVLNYVVGAYYYRLDAENRRDITFGPLAVAVGIPPGATAPLFATNRTTSGALYGNITYHLGPLWKLEGGVRFTHEKQTAFYTVDTSPAPQFGLATGVYQHVLRSNEWTPTVTLTYNLNDHSHVYARYAKGYKSGGFNMDFVSAAIFPDRLAFAPEHSNDYELGFKSTFWHQRAKLSADLFDTIYHGFQLSRYLFFPNTTQIIISNTGTVRTRGAELDGALQAAPGLTLRASLGYLDGVFTNYPDANSAGDNFAGHRLPTAPRFSGSIGIGYTHPLGGVLYGSLTLQYSYRTAYYSNVQNQKTAMLAGQAIRYGYTPGHGLLDVSYTVSPLNSTWDVQLWARNLTNKHYVQDYFEDFFNTLVADPGAPRTYGVRFGLHF